MQKGGSYVNLADLEKAILNHIQIFSSEENLKKLKPTVEEGMYIIEHLLLRPEIGFPVSNERIKSPTPRKKRSRASQPNARTNQSQPPIITSKKNYGQTIDTEILEYLTSIGQYANSSFMNICSDGCDDQCALDPYSFKAQVILPGTGSRFSNPDFRNFMESLIQAEFPSHIIPRICWISECQMSEFQKIYHEYLDQKAVEMVSPITLMNLLNILSELRTINPKGRLHDCETDDFTGKVILGRSNI